MKKGIMITVHNNTTIFVIIAPIQCSIHDEQHIKYKIESDKNNPRFLLAVIMRNLAPEQIRGYTSQLKELENAIKNCDMLSAEFLEEKDIPQKIHELVEKTKLLHFCPN